MTVTLRELADLVGGTIAGDGNTVIRGVNGIKEAAEGEITFLANGRYALLLASTRASAVILAGGIESPIPSITVRNPDLAFAQVAERLNEAPARPAAGVHPTAVVHPGATLGREVAIGACAIIEDGAVIGDGSVIHPLAYVGNGVRMGPECRLYPQVVVRERCRLGARVILHSGVVVGADGFGFVTVDGVHRKIPQTGIVVLEDDVEVGANSTIDRARFGKTVVEKGAKIDNLVMIAHNVVVGQGTLIAAQAGISGSTRLGKDVRLGGQVGLSGHLEVGDGATVTAQSGIGKSVPPGAMVSGEYAVDTRAHLKRLAAIARLPEALTEIKRLQAEVEALKKKLGEE